LKVSIDEVKEFHKYQNGPSDESDFSDGSHFEFLRETFYNT
jgi:hypothetical protein